MPQRLVSQFNTAKSQTDLPSMSAAPRLVWLDALKGFLILLVVLGHAIQYTRNDFDELAATHYIYAFHMALFMFISGFVLYRPELKWHALPRKMLRLLLPFFTWFTVSFLLFDRSDFGGKLLDLLLRPDKGLWFLWVLAIGIAIIFALNATARRLQLPEELFFAAGAAGLFALYMATRFNGLGFQLLMWYFVFLAGGYVLAKHINRLRHPKLEAAAVMLCGVLYIVLAWNWSRKGDIILGVATLGGLAAYGWRLAAAIAGTLFWFGMFHLKGEKKSQMPLMKHLAPLGRLTLGIYAAHFTVLELLRSLADRWEPSVWKTAVFWLTSAVLAAVLTVILAKNRFTALLFLGDLPRRNRIALKAASRNRP